MELYPKGMSGFKRFIELIDMMPEVQDVEDAVEVASLKGDIGFKYVSFRYEDSKSVLEKINHRIPAGETVAFVGPMVFSWSFLISLLIK